MKCLGILVTTLRAGAIAWGMMACAHAGPGDWGGQGPFGGTVSALKADPIVPTRLYATTSNGFFRSDDAGTSWAVAENGLLDAHPSTAVFAVSPTVSGALWLFDDAGRLYASADAGNNWLPTGYVLGTSTASTSLAQGVGNIVWLAANAGGLRKSTDSGGTFASVSGGGFPAGQTVTFVATSPHDVLLSSQHIVAGTASNCDGGTGVCPIYASADGGATWTSAAVGGALVAGGATQQLVAVAFGPSPGNTVYALYGGPIAPSTYLLSSSDNGASWTAHTAQTGSSLAASPADALTVWVDSSKSINGGTAFTPLGTTGRNTNGTLVPGTSAIAVSPNYPGTPRVWIGTPFAGLYLSNDDGATWTSSDDGMAATDIRSVIVHPVDNTRIFAGFGDSLTDPSQAFYRSTSVGTWAVSNAGLFAWQLRTVLIDPTTAGTVGSTVLFGVGSGYDSSTIRNNTTRNSGIYKSFDGGLTWATQTGGPALHNGLSSPQWAGNLRTVVADPRSCDGRLPTAAVCNTGPLQTLYVTGGGRLSGATHLYRVMKSVDGGASWADSSNGLPADILDVGGTGSADRVDGVTPIVMDPSNSATLYIGTFASAYGPDSANNPPATPQVLSGVFKSTDSGATWVRKSSGLPTYPGSLAVFDTLSLAIDPSNPQTLWVSTISADFTVPGELYKTTNGGDNWALSNAGITGPDVRALLADPSNPGTVYAASGGLGPANPGGVYKSTDGGTTWKSISVGLPAFSATALTLDPIDPTVLYAGTNGGVYSVVQLPDADADGVPDLIENSGPNGGDANFDSSQDSIETTVGTTAPGLFGGWQSGTSNASQAAQLALLTQNLQAMAMQAQYTDAGIQGGYFTVQVDGGCTQAVDIAPANPGPLGQDIVAHYGTYTYPRALVRFELPQCDSATVKVTFNAATFGPGWSWRFYGPSIPGNNSTMGWHDATSLVTSQIGNTWTIQLTKGQFGSYRPAGTGAILFEGGPAYDETIFNDKFDSPSS